MTTFRASSLADIDGFRATHSRMNAFAPSSQPKGMLRLPMPDWLTPSLKKIIRSSFSMANSESHMAVCPMSSRSTGIRFFSTSTNWPPRKR